MVFNISALSFDQWMVVLKFSFPVLLVDECLKFVARNYTDGKNTLRNILSNWREGFALIASIVAYGYYWYMSEKHIMDKILASRRS